MSGKLSFTYEDPRVLKKNTWNPNEMSPEAETKLRNSLEQNGHIRPILVRELEDGTKEIVGGEHRVDISIELGHTEVPTINLGKITDEQAKKALLLDNSRYGEDEAGKLATLLEDIGTADELAEWTNLGEDDLMALMGGAADVDLSSLDELDELEYMDDDDEPAEAPTKDVMTHQTMKFKVPVENADLVKDVIDGIIKVQKLDDSDATIRAGEALVWLARDYVQEDGAEEELAEIDELSLEELDHDLS